MKIQGVLYVQANSAGYDYTKWKTELIKIATIQIGAIYLITTVKIFSLLKGDESLISSDRVLGLMTQPMKMQVRKATIGIITLLLM